MYTRFARLLTNSVRTNTAVTTSEFLYIKTRFIYLCNILLIKSINPFASSFEYVLHQVGEKLKTQQMLFAMFVNVISFIVSIPNYHVFEISTVDYAQRRHLTFG